MLPIVSKEFGKACFKAMMSWTIAVEGGEVTSADFTLWAGFGLVVGALNVDFEGWWGCCCMNGGCLH